GQPTAAWRDRRPPPTAPRTSSGLRGCRTGSARRARQHRPSARHPAWRCSRRPRGPTRTDHTLATALPVDMIIDATGVPEIGAEVALRSLLAGRHVGLLNVETDITVGWLLSRIAAQSGAVYTLCRGDEPAEALKLVAFAR